MQKIFWADLEMTGLDPNDCVIIEFAGIITNLKFETLDHFEYIIYQPDSILREMDEWNKTTHGNSGLLKQIPSGTPLPTVEKEILGHLKKHFPEGERPILAGNSIHQDRKFIDRYMPELADYLHYRMIDVSSFKQIFNHLYGVRFSKKNSHRAVDDIEESINELKHYLSHLNLPPIF